MHNYLEIVQNVLDNGVRKENRTGTDALSVLGCVFRHDMTKGFPLLTTKKMAFISIKVELEGFLNGITSKKWYQDRGCHIWDEWCNPDKIPSGLTEAERKAFQKQEDDLGLIYGHQWETFNSDRHGHQLKNVIKELKRNKNSRQMLVSAWNPLQIDKMALPPCHFAFQLTTTNGKLNLTWYQRSCDVMLGLPFNIASYGLLLHLIAKKVKMKEGELVGMLNDTHIYTNHIDGAKEQLERTPMDLPTIESDTFFDILCVGAGKNWDHDKTQLFNYKHHEKIKFEVAI